MSDELQALLDKINEEGLKKADEQREAVLAAAEKEARSLVEAAKSESEQLLEQARKDADLLRAKGEESLRQASRDVLLSLRRQLEVRVQTVARSTVSEALSPERVAAILKELVTGFLAQDEAEEGASVQLSAEQVEEVQSHLENLLAADLVSRVDLVPVRGLAAGFRVQRKGEDILYDFSDTALAEALATFVNPRLAKIMSADGESAAGGESDSGGGEEDS